MNSDPEKKNSFASNINDPLSDFRQDLCKIFLDNSFDNLADGNHLILLYSSSISLFHPLQKPSSLFLIF